MAKVYNVLFLCTGNSARSIMAEAATTRWGKDRFRAFSAGSHPAGRVHPRALELLGELNYPTHGFRSKSWDEFAAPEAPRLDFVFTVCDKAAGEACPFWPGQPMTAHWGVEDPAGFHGTADQERAVFLRAYTALENRIKIFTSLRLEDIDALSLQNRLDEIGRLSSTSEIPHQSRWRTLSVSGKTPRTGDGEAALTVPQHPPASPNLSRRVVAEAVGTALLLATVVGSGIMGERLAGGNVAVALLANTLATGAGLVALILTFGPISGAHFNPAVTIADASQGGLAWRDVGPYVVAQVTGAFAGVAAAHVMFEAPLFSASRHARGGGAQAFSEFVATFGLLAVIWGCARTRSTVVPFAVGAYITAAYWFTASTSFANPAVTLARSATDTFAGIRPADAPAFITAQLIGAAVATALFRWLLPSLPVYADAVVMPGRDDDGPGRDTGKAVVPHRSRVDT